MRDRDYFSWRWADDDKHGDSGPYRSYHCKSRRAISVAGRLYDTFWGDGSSDIGLLNLDNIHLVFLGNLGDMEPIRRSDAVCYRHDDLIDTAHSNNSGAPVFLKKGATRNRQVMLEYVNEQLDDSKRDYQYQIRRMAELRKKVFEIENSEVLDEVYL